MEVRDGFIVGIFNYCDRWCETCAFTSHCRLFADVAEIEAKLDPNHKPIVDAPPLPEEAPPPLPKWMQELIDEMNDAARDADAHEDLPRRREPPVEHQAIEARADEYHTRAYAWLRGRSWSVHDARDPCAVISWFHMQIMVKVHRAVHALVEENEDEWEGPRDSDGSAKVALNGIDRSHAAWLALVERGAATHAEVAPFIADLVWLGESLERVFPKARGFVRPGLDEPDEVTRLIARDGA